MISHLMNNPNFSNAINQVGNANNKSATQINAKNDSVDDKQKTSADKKVSSSKLESLKESIQNGTYKIDLRGSAEKLAQELLR